MSKVEMRDYSVIKEVIRDSIDPILLLEHYGADIPQRNIKYDKAVVLALSTEEITLLGSPFDLD
jgi:hypothetical protein